MSQFKVFRNVSEVKGIILTSAFLTLPLAFMASGNAGSERRERPVTWSLLSDNARYNVPRIETGATYETNPVPDNPRDNPANPRLQDGDHPYGDWNNTIGWSRRDGEVTFDLKDAYQVAAVELRLRSTDPGRSPQHISLFWRQGEQGDWHVGPETPVKPEVIDDDRWVMLRFDRPVEARFVRTLLANKEGFNYLMQIRVWGMQAGDSVENVHAPSEIEASPPVKALVQSGQATGAILVDEVDSDDVITAARDLQEILKKMTGVLVPLLSDTADIEALPDGALRLAVGPRMAKRFGVEVEQDYTGGDYYLLRSRVIGEEKSPVLVIAGNDSGERRGTNYAVYDFLRRLGCGWYGPDQLWHVIPEYEELAIKPVNVEERADFGTARNLRILTQFPGEEHRRLRDAWRTGGRRVGSGHSLGRSVLPREKYVDEHPDWYGPSQVNLTHPGAINQTIEELRERLDNSDAERPVAIGIGAQDTGGWADDERSREVGNISSQYLYFANLVARGLRETHPGEFQLVFYGYWFTHQPPNPMREAEPEIVVEFLHQGNKARSWVDPLPVDDYHGSNVRQLRHFLGWKETGAEMAIYNWWIPGYGRDEWKKVPWYKGQNAVDNLRLWHEHGVQTLEYETMRRDEIGDGFPIRWALFYVASQAFWDVNRDADDILREALDHLYEDAASPMFDYYQTLKKALTQTELRASNWNLPSPERIYTPEIREQASAYLAQAADVVPSGRPELRLAQEKAIWEEAVRVMEKLEEEAKTVSYDLIINDTKKFEINNPLVTESIIRSLVGIPEAVTIIVVEPDGQTREIAEGEEYDLRAGIKFTTEE